MIFISVNVYELLMRKDKGKIKRKSAENQSISCIMVSYGHLSIPVLLLSAVSVKSFPFPEECGINFIEPDNINNASR